jgi:hypothetical protein
MGGGRGVRSEWARDGEGIVERAWLRYVGVA